MPILVTSGEGPSKPMTHQAMDVWVPLQGPATDVLAPILQTSASNISNPKPTNIPDRLPGSKVTNIYEKYHGPNSLASMQGASMWCPRCEVFGWSPRLTAKPPAPNANEMAFSQHARLTQMTLVAEGWKGKTWTYNRFLRGNLIHQTKNNSNTWKTCIFACLSDLISISFDPFLLTLQPSIQRTRHFRQPLKPSINTNLHTSITYSTSHSSTNINYLDLYSTTNDQTTLTVRSSTSLGLIR